MQIEKRLRDDFWKAIQAHYSNGDFTEAVRDAFFFTTELLQELSGIDKDNSKLIDSTFLGNNPIILVNKNETTTEKDIQQGIGFALKGLIQATRNPMSHKKTEIPQADAEAILLYMNYLINIIKSNDSTTTVEGITELIFDEDFTDTKEYAELLIKKIPTKKRYDLLMEIYNRREELPNTSSQAFIATLIDALSKNEKSAFIRAVSNSLMKCKNDQRLYSYIQLFMEKTFYEVDRLVRLRIENLVFRSINAGEMVPSFDPDTMEFIDVCNDEGMLGAVVVKKLHMLGNEREIFESLLYATTVLHEGSPGIKYINEYLGDFILNFFDQMTTSELTFVRSCLSKGNRFYYDLLRLDIEDYKDEKMIELFGKEFEECKSIVCCQDQ